MRWVVDRRAQPSENNGTLTIAGERGEVLKAAVEHAVPSRGHTDSEELRSAIESARARQPPQGERPASSRCAARLDRDGWTRQVCCTSGSSGARGHRALVQSNPVVHQRN